jgi:hypothetical protein
LQADQKGRRRQEDNQEGSIKKSANKKTLNNNHKAQHGIAQRAAGAYIMGRMTKLFVSLSGA